MSEEHLLKDKDGKSYVELPEEFYERIENGHPQTYLDHIEYTPVYLPEELQNI
jgi:hypothetical protein